MENSIKSMVAVAAFMILAGGTLAAPGSPIPDDTEVTVVQNGGMLNFTGPVMIIHEKAIGSKDTFTLTEGKKRSIYVSRGDKVTRKIMRIPGAKKS